MSDLIKHTHGMYGFFPGGDPRRFSPDRDGQSEEEAKAHAEACQRWNDAEKAGQQAAPEAGSCIHAGPVILTLARFGLGVYEYDCDDPDCPDSHPPDPREPNAEEQVNRDQWDAACNDVLEANADDDGMPF